MGMSTRVRATVTLPLNWTSSTGAVMGGRAGFVARVREVAECQRSPYWLSPIAREESYELHTPRTPRYILLE